MRNTLRIGRLSVPLALLLSFAVAGQAFAAGWTKVTVATDAYMAGLATSADGTALAAYEKCDGPFCAGRTYIKRSTDGGATWGNRLELPNGSNSASLAARGSNVDLVWRDGTGRLIYQRSTNAGLSFGPRVRLTENFLSTTEPTVARGSAGLVVVSWGELGFSEERIVVRVSTDGGQSFGPPTAWQTIDMFIPSSVAAGDGVAYVAHVNGVGAPVVRRSLDGGDTWSKVLTADETPYAYEPVIVANGTVAFVTYGTIDANEHRDARYRQTTNSGTDWSASMHLAAATESAYRPTLALQGGVIRALYATDHGLFYLESDDGTTWTDPEFVSPRTYGFLAYAGRPIVLQETLLDVVVRFPPVS